MKLSAVRNSEGLSQEDAYARVMEMSDRLAKARREGRVDVEAASFLNPELKNLSEEAKLKKAQEIQASVGISKEAALNRVVNMWSGDNAKINKVLNIVATKTYGNDDEIAGVKKGDKAQGVIFAHNKDSIKLLKTNLEAKGYRVGVIDGQTTTGNKENIKNQFNTTRDKQKYDILLLSDAGATGLNLQNSKWLVNYDLPQTSWVKEQREGRIDRHGQQHREIDYHDIVTQTQFDKNNRARIERKSEIGSVFQQDPGRLDDTGILHYISKKAEKEYDHA